MRSGNIITSETKELIYDLEENIRDGQDDELSLRQPFASLISHLAQRCGHTLVRERYNGYRKYIGSIGQYPVDNEGYAASFNPLEDETNLFESWQRYGVTVAKNAVPPELCEAGVSKVHATIDVLSKGAVDIGQPETFGALAADANGTPILSRGFFEVYHDDSIAQLRQSLRAYLHHVIMWGQPDLWTTFDRFGVKLPGHDESAALPLHVDQNPNIHPRFRTTQGLLALEDCPRERGTIVVVPGSKSRFDVYGRMALNKGEYVELGMGDRAASELADNAQPLPLRQGDLVTWDSRTTHANTANISDKTRYVALISAGPARPDNHDAVLAREQAFITGEGSNARDALMHASRRPRYSDYAALQFVRVAEKLSPLGKLLYGQIGYDEI